MGLQLEGQYWRIRSTTMYHDEQKHDLNIQRFEDRGAPTYNDYKSYSVTFEEVGTQFPTGADWYRFLKERPEFEGATDVLEEQSLWQKIKAKVNL